MGDERMTRILGLLAGLLVLAGCKEEALPEAEPIRPVRTIVAESQANGEEVRLTGEIQAQDTVLLSFRTGGRLISRTVNVGDTVSAGDLLGQLEDTTQINNVQAARAELTAAEGDVERTEVDYGRQVELLERGFTTRQRYDTALQVFRQAQSRADAARAQLANAEEALAFTALYADAEGVVTAIGAEPGEVVAAGAPVVRLARENGRDAVFDVPERLIQTVPPYAEISVSLVSTPDIGALGRIREVAPEADPVTRTFQVRIGLSDIPPEFRLGSSVVGRVVLPGTKAKTLPASALTTAEGRSAVFIVDPATNTVSLRKVEVSGFDLANVRVISGLKDGDIVVTAGVQALRDGQIVRFGGGS